MANTSVVALSTLVAQDTSVGGVNAAFSGTTRSSLQVTTAASSTSASNGTSSATRQLVTAAGAGLIYNPGVLQLITGTGAGFESEVGTSRVALQNIVATGRTGSNFSQQALQPITGVGTTCITGFSSASLERIASVSVGLAGVLGVSTVSMLARTARGAGGGVAVGTSSVALPLITAAGKGYVGTGATFSAVVMNTETQALWTYTNFGFNSFARFNGQILAASDGGLFQLAGDNDNGVSIDASARMGTTDFNTSHLKRVERVYMGYRSAGEMVLRVRTDETNVRDYLVPRTTYAGLHGNHVKLGRGLEARYWQFEVRNRNGSDFSLNMLECKPIVLKRRIGRNDA